MSGWGAWGKGSWGGGSGSNDALVQQVKDWQRKGPGYKQAWDNFCHAQGETKLDPARKDEVFLTTFLEGTQAGSILPTEDVASSAWGGYGGGGKDDLVKQVKTIQKKGEGHKQAWYSYCKQQGSGDFDPNRHDESILQAFVDGVNSGTIQPEADDGWGGGSWGSSKKKGGGGGDDWWGQMETMMQMMMTMKGAMKGGGKGGGGKGGGGKPGTGEIRYQDPAEAMAAVECLQGTEINGSAISIEVDPASQDGTKLIVSGLPAGLQWQELKDHFGMAGTVAYAGVNGGGKGKGKGKSPY